MPPLGMNKGPAPVLPAMGLHSFHNDSPPFAGAAMADYGHPDPLSLDDPATGDGDVPGRGNSDSPELSDAEFSRARSRRLVSGYRFGNPPSPVTSGLATTLGLGARYEDVDDAAADAQAADAARAAEQEETRESDSPPLTEQSISEGYADVDEGVIVVGTSPTVGPNTVPAAPNPAANGLQLEGDTTTVTHSPTRPAATATSLRRRSERGSRARLDAALTGLNDGEADADASAPKAEHSSESYLKGEGEYRFPKHRLRRTMKDESKIPLVIVACGSFSPPTYLHLRMFEMAKDEIVESQTYEIMAGYYSPVSSYYKKAGLAPAIHRVRMCELAVEHTSTWLMVDPWEAGQPEYQRTAIVLDHFDELLNGPNGGVHMADGSRRRYKVMLLAGGDLIESFGEPGVWSEPDLHIILGRFGCLIVERAGSDVWAFLLSHDILYHHRRNVIVIKQLIYNDISSTKVRLFVRRGMSIKYLLPNSVIQYIHEHKLYREPDRKPITITAA